MPNNFLVSLIDYEYLQVYCMGMFHTNCDLRKLAFMGRIYAKLIHAV